ncbi:MAG: site-specific DNA-methyltransferase [Kofleriaceae bacterium]
MWSLARAGRRFRLIYLDPPFHTGRRFCTAAGELAFDDRWPSLDSYVAWIRCRLVAARELLERDGSLVVHVDPSVSHHVRIVLDEVFGRESFASEIVWRYRRWPTKGTNFQKVHDVLLRYVRDPKVAPCWNQLHEPLAPSTVRTWGDRRQEAVLDACGKRRRSARSEARSPGALLGDVWEIPIVAPVAKERTGYPTQKPEKLLARLIEACTNAGDSVLDPCCGSGTTLAAARALGRRAVGIDESPVALRVARARLKGRAT